MYLFSSSCFTTQKWFLPAVEIAFVGLVAGVGNTWVMGSPAMYLFLSFFFSFPFILLLCFSSPINYYFIIFHFNYLCFYFIFILNFSFSYSYVLRDICIYSSWSKILELFVRDITHCILRCIIFMFIYSSFYLHFNNTNFLFYFP